MLGVAPSLRYRVASGLPRLVKRHHPDHNGGSAESAAHFAQIQNAYARSPTTARRRSAQPPAPPGRVASAPLPPTRPAQPAQGHGHRGSDRQPREGRWQRQRGRRSRRGRLSRPGSPRVTASDADQAQRGGRPEELGYYTTDDSFTKIIDDAADEFSERLTERQQEAIRAPSLGPLQSRRLAAQAMLRGRALSGRDSDPRES